jgi:hypothetical protein
MPKGPFIPECCPKCKQNLVGEEIPVEWRGALGNQVHFSNVEPIYSLESESLAALRCPGCRHEWKAT